MNPYSKYHQSLQKEFYKLSKVSNSIFLGQQVAKTSFYNLLTDISIKKRIEMPVCEELQMSVSIGLAMENYLPISIFQRMDFLPRAMDSLVNHLDIMKEMTRGQFNPKIIIISTVGSTFPLDSGLQHSKDLIDGFRALLKNIKVFNPKTVKEVNKSFEEANKYDGSSLLVFYQDLWSDNK